MHIIDLLHLHHREKKIFQKHEVQHYQYLLLSRNEVNQLCTFHYHGYYITLSSYKVLKIMCPSFLFFFFPSPFPYEVPEYQVWNTSLPTATDSPNSSKGLPAVLHSFMAGFEAAGGVCLFAGLLPRPADWKKRQNDKTA